MAFEQFHGLDAVGGGADHGERRNIDAPFDLAADDIGVIDDKKLDHAALLLVSREAVKQPRS